MVARACLIRTSNSNPCATYSLSEGGINPALPAFIHCACSCQRKNPQPAPSFSSYPASQRWMDPCLALASISQKQSAYCVYVSMGLPRHLTSRTMAWIDNNVWYVICMCAQQRRSLCYNYNRNRICICKRVVFVKAWVAIRKRPNQ
jgi:hypothetical protein